jgi:uncharacterized membrane protein YvlD (DUF360 family)
VLNGLMFWLAGSLLEGFVVGGFCRECLAPFSTAFSRSLLSSLLPTGRSTQ